MADRFQDKIGGLSDPYREAFAVTPADGADLALYTRGIWVGGAGNINLDTVGGNTILISGIQAGTLLPIRAKRIRSTSTTATLIVGLV